MKKTLLTIAVIVGAIAAVSCQKDSSKENLTSAPQFTATIEDGSSTKTTVEKVAGTPATYKTNWESTDQISVNGAVYTATPKTDATKADFNYTSGTAPTEPYSAYYPAALYDGTTATLPASYTYSEGKYNMPMYAYNATTTSLSFKNLCGVLAITVPGTQITSVSSITVISDKQLNGAFTANSEGVLTFASKTFSEGVLTSASKTLNAADKKVTLTFSEPKSIGSGSSETFYIPVPAGTHDPLTINVSNGSIMKTMVTKKSGGVELVRNTVYPIAFADNQPDMLPGLFTVGKGPDDIAGTEDDKKVRFSKGNLRYTVASAKWDFYDNQYDFCNTSTYAGHHEDTVSLFTWGYNATKSIVPNGEDSDNVIITSGNLSQSEDWGCTIGDGNTWRTLSSSEWVYLLSSTDDGGRGDGDSKFKSGVEVVGKSNCLIIAPDGYTGTIAASYDAAEWSAAESQGLVCLPAAAYRNGSNVDDVGDFGNYWSSTPYGEDTAYSLYFSDDYVDPESSDYRRTGNSVRLVYSAQ